MYILHSSFDFTFWLRNASERVSFSFFFVFVFVLFFVLFCFVLFCFVVVDNVGNPKRSVGQKILNKIYNNLVKQIQIQQTFSGAPKQQSR